MNLWDLIKVLIILPLYMFFPKENIDFYCVDKSSVDLLCFVFLKKSFVLVKLLVKPPFKSHVDSLADRTR